MPRKPMREIPLSLKALPAAALLFAWSCAPKGVSAATTRVAGFAAERQLSGLGTVTALAFAPDGTLFMTEKNGMLRVLAPGAATPKIFATVPVYTSSECGLLGVALDPDYTSYGTGGHVYVFATVSGSEQRILRFRDTAGTGTERKDIKTGLPTLGANHDGGCLKIAPDGKMYAAIGDGGSGSSKAQDLTNLFGKVLRLNLDGSIPDDNPFLTRAGARGEIFAYGFRNPFRIALRSTGPGPSDYQVWIDDVGSSGTVRREEVNLVLAGLNYGWPNVEGVASNPSYVNPIRAYSSDGNSIVGGAFYQGTLFPETYRGNYFYMDYVSNKVFRMVLNGDVMASNEIFVDAEGGLIDIAQGPEGALYYSTGDGQVFRLRYETPGNRRPVVALSADRRSGAAPLEVTFDAGGSLDPDGSVVRYDWYFGDAVSKLAGGPQATHAYSKDGVYTARVVVTDNSGGASAATLSIEVKTVNLPPVPEILLPLAGSSYDAGATVELSGRALDPEDGEIGASGLRWDVILHHEDHDHPFVTGKIGATASFDIPRAEIDEGWTFEIRLTATDSRNSSASATRTVDLNYLPLSLDSEPPGLRLTANGVSLFAPATYSAANGSLVELGAPSPQLLDDNPYRWKSWSDGGAATHQVTAAQGLSVQAVFEPEPRATFIRADSNRDGAVDISDAVFTLAGLFTGGPLWACPDAADANDDGQLDIADAIATLSYLFAEGKLPPPGPAPAFDPTPDDLPCEALTPTEP